MSVEGFTTMDIINQKKIRLRQPKYIGGHASGIIMEHSTLFFVAVVVNAAAVR